MTRFVLDAIRKPRRQAIGPEILFHCKPTDEAVVQSLKENCKSRVITKLERTTRELNEASDKIQLRIKLLTYVAVGLAVIQVLVAIIS